MIHVSCGNTKLGKIANISLMPVTTCLPNAECAKHCYAKRALMYPSTKVAWNANTELYFKEPIRYFADLSTWLNKKRPPYFRWHVGGDCPDKAYVRKVVNLALMHPETKFLMFTKQLDMVTGLGAPNLNIILSMWPYMAVGTDKTRMRAWVEGHSGTPKDVHLCRGKCIDCLHCWTKGGKDILLRSH